MQYGLIGEKLSHSFSKEIHSLFADYSYELKELKREELPLFFEKRDFKGINVTIPYKQSVMEYLDFIELSAKAIGAVNTVVNIDGKLNGYNTDFYGMCSLIEKLKIKIKNQKVVILGTGGTSKTAKAVAQSSGAKEILVVSRTAADGVITYDELKKSHTDATVLINTTPVGMYPANEGEIIDLSLFPRLVGVVDAVYNPLKSNLVLSAEKRGIRAGGGLYMLVAQGAAAAEKFLCKDLSKKTNSAYLFLKKQKQNIVLVGMAGCGKTTIGKILAENSGKKFVDTDEIIEQREGRKISEIFKTDGEEYFRNKETEVISEVSKNQSLIIATGGGAVLRRENIEKLRQNGVILFLDRPLKNIPATDSRPLSSNREDLKKRYFERRPIYLSVADKRYKIGENATKNADKIIKDLKL